MLAHNLGRPYETIFAEFEGASTLEAVTSIPQGGTGDVKYHHGAQGTYQLPNGDAILVNLESNPSHLEYVHPVVVGAHARRADDAPGHARPPRHQRRGADRPARRRRDARPGRRRRVAEPPGARRLQGRRHASTWSRTTRSASRPIPRTPLDALGVGHRQGLRRADHPRQRRRRGRLRLRRRGWPSPSARSSATTSSSTSSATAASATTRPTSPRTRSPRCTRRSRPRSRRRAVGRAARRAGRHHPGGGRAAAPGVLGPSSSRLHQDLKAQIKAAEDAGTVEQATGEYQLDRSPSPEVQTAGRGRPAQAQRGAAARPRGLHGPPQARQAARAPPRGARRRRRHRLGARRGAGLRLAAHRGRAGPPDRPGRRARDVLPAPHGPARRQDGPDDLPDPDAPRGLGALRAAQLAAERDRRLGFEYGYSPRRPRRSCCGRRSSATSATPPRSSSTSSSSAAWPSGARRRA